MTRCVRRIFCHITGFFHCVGSIEPEMCPTDTGREAPMTLFCCSQSVTVGARNQDIFVRLRL